MMWFKKKKGDSEDKKKDKKDEKTESQKNRKLSGEEIRVRVHALINNSPLEKYSFIASLVRDDDNNTVMFNEDNNFKEEFPGVQDALISDILYKLESSNLSKTEQSKKVEKAIDKQNKILKSIKNGKIIVGEDEIRVNHNTEKQRLRLLKCTQYVLENKKGEGFYEAININGERVLNYLIRDGELIPYWHKIPDVNGEPVTLTPDVVQRKKYYKDRTDEIINDFNSGDRGWWNGLFGLITKGFALLFVLGLIVSTFFLINKYADLRDESLQPELDALKVENEAIRQDCSRQIANQIENNEVLIDVAKKYLVDSDGGTDEVVDKSNIQI